MIGWLDERAAERRLGLAAAALGVALGGQFAALVKHAPSAELAILLFVLLIGALFSMWRRRALLTRVPGRRLAGAMLIGFGGFQLADALLIDWLIGGDLPALGDLWWLLGFGVGALLLGWRLLQPGHGPAPRRPRLGASAGSRGQLRGL